MSTPVHATGMPPAEDSARAPLGSVLALVVAELRLVLREPLVLAFVFAFPIITVLVIAGSFDSDDDGFGGVEPSQWYVASYLAVVIAAIGLVMVPVHLAAYRERGVLRRFAAAGFPRWSFLLAQLVVGLVLTLVASAVLLAVAAPVYGLPAVQDPLPVAAALLLGALAFTVIGLLIGSLVPNARAAQGLGLLAFFPSFLLGGGGPPPAVMSEGVRTVSELMPLMHVTDAIREPWLGTASGQGHLLVVAVVLVVALLACARSVRL
ncbi:MAG: ABC transporter permease [Actinomycetota bacterium]|nr:ABC transporter permease [Actinomycetota bacterium]